MHDHIVLRAVAKFLIPFLMMYGLYVQLHGEYSPGGGFQAGVIFATAFILYCLIWGLENLKKVLSAYVLRVLCSIGVLLYFGTGIVTMAMGGSMLEYSVLMSDPVSGQKIGILIIELGVGITVFSVMLLIFYIFAGLKKN